ncbi:hypothetical protein SNOG_20169 [Parastagonospora nodorum SN15]|uniref:Uncharacterized protein n=1 Tax=Phaeosphaeria nodorum (strain SN15 / ATCC MYA-4574 / FGSC 10173) TaxID=321614 RepID=A9JXG5_PHANO|nr:hypothetical protein SNOG_20169 [Parastagonospora nodorum SN15]EDP89866.1 hypothetical protein SNOG_20169 [Parastagonospora nodorum SN15]
MLAAGARTRASQSPLRTFPHPSFAAAALSCCWLPAATVFSGASLSTNKPLNGSNSHVSQRIKNFFRINSSNDTRNISDDANHISFDPQE